MISGFLWAIHAYAFLDISKTKIWPFVHPASIAVVTALLRPHNALAVLLAATESLTRKPLHAYAKMVNLISAWPIASLVIIVVALAVALQLIVKVVQSTAIERSMVVHVYARQDTLTIENRQHALHAITLAAYVL